MDERIQIRSEKRRGCGLRKAGALYLVDFDSPIGPCGKMPVPLAVCPCCGQGVKPARQWTWVNADSLLREAKTERECDCEPLDLCPMHDKADPIGRAGLLWTGERHYPTPKDFMREAQAQGISRRIKFLPPKFKLGETWVLLAHIRAIPAIADDAEPTPGIFFMFKPRAVEYVCTGNEATAEIDRLIGRGITPVFVVNPPESVAKEEDGEEYI